MISEMINDLVKSNIKFLQIITKETFVVLDEVDSVLKNYVEDVIHYDYLDGFDVPVQETMNNAFSETINKWMYEKTLEKTAIVITASDAIFEDEKSVLAIRKIIGSKSPEIVSRPHILIVISDSDCMPLTLKELGTIIKAPLMSQKECECFAKKILIETGLPKKLAEETAKELLGLTQNQVESCIKQSANKKEDVFLNSLKLKKAELLNQSGLLSIENPCDEKELGGFENLKAWLEEIKTIPENDEGAAVFPKGMLLVGVTGCGKSLAARVTASVLNMPLLRIDFGKLMNKYVGESEKNLINALQVVEAISPCVLWMDEFEKAFGNADENAGVSQRMLGQFLTWLQERNERIFTVATVNNVSKLPAELLRRGRFDKIYYVDLPEDEERKNIIKIHAGKVNIELDDIEIGEISSEMQGRDYSGADIEYLMKESKRRSYFYNEEKPEIIDIVKMCLRDTTPVGSIMSVEINEMRKEFKSRGFDNVNEKGQGRADIKKQFLRKK